MITQEITPELLERLFLRIEPKGILIWKPRPREDFASDQAMKTWNKRFAGKEAGCEETRNGKTYKALSIFGRTYRFHRIVSICRGYNIDGMQIDHIDGNGLNNSENNIRIVTHNENLKNQGIHCNNISGCMGVHFDKKANKFRAQIGHSGERYHLGYFDTLEKAEAARKQVEIDFGFHPNHGMRDSENRERRLNG